MINLLLNKVFGTDSEREIRALRPVIAAVNDLEPTTQHLSDLDLAAKTVEFKERCAHGSTLDELLPEAFAVVREAGRRVLNLRHFDVQLIGGIVLHRCGIAEMKAGEGKTLVATAPAYLNALSGKGVHVVTLNDYFSKRDAEWMGHIYRFLGLTVGLIVHDLNDGERRQSYHTDITYGSSSEFGLDYLRDNMKFNLANCSQRGHNYAIVDEVDSILIDEARTPLSIASTSEESTDKYLRINRIIRMLVRGAVIEDKKPGQNKITGDYALDEKNQTAELTDEGVRNVERLLGSGDPTTAGNKEYNHLVRQALKAHHFFRCDRDYVVRDDGEGLEVVIVDKSTGRSLEGSRWTKGLHQAIEAKEGVRVQPESRTLAAISVQNYFRLYRGLAGMSGTAVSEADEFRQVYRLPVVAIPANRPIQSRTFTDIVYRTEEEKWRNAAKDIQERNANGQPVLAGVARVDKLTKLAAVLGRMGVRYRVLGTESLEESRQSFARAGRRKEVLLCAMAAGRGLNIFLGGEPEYLAQDECRQRNLAEPLLTNESSADALSWYRFSDAGLNAYRVRVGAWREALARHEANCQREREEVVRLGGLHVLALDRHWWRRFDDRFSNHAGIQGELGSCQFILSLQDELLLMFGGERMQNLMLRLGMEEDVPIESGMITNRIRQAQRANEERSLAQRTHLLGYDDVLNQQRQTVYSMRRQLLDGLDQKERVHDMTRSVIGGIVASRCPRNVHLRAWDLAGIQTDMLTYFGVHLNSAEMTALKAEQIEGFLFEKAREVYQAKENLIGASLLRDAERNIILHIIDDQWKDHLRAMDNLEEGIDMRSFGTTGMIEEAKKGAAGLLVGGIAAAVVRSNKPLAYFREKATGLFDGMMRQVESETVRYLFFLRFESRADTSPFGEQLDEDENPRDFDEDSDVEEGDRNESRGATSAPSGIGAGGNAPTTARRLGRNDPCPCGSGKRYKKCHGA